VSSLKCDRRLRSNLESCLAAVGATSGKLILQAEWLCHGIRAVAVSKLAGWPAAPTQWAWTGVQRVCRGRGGLLGSHSAWRKRNKLELKLGAILNTIQGSLLTYPTHHAHIQTHPHTLRVAQWAHLCGLGTVASTARPVSGVEWSRGLTR